MILPEKISSGYRAAGYRSNYPIAHLPSPSYCLRRLHRIPRQPHESPPPHLHRLALCSAVRRRRRHGGGAAQAGRAGSRAPAARSRCRPLRRLRHRAQPHRLRSDRCPSSPPATTNSSRNRLLLRARSRRGRHGRASRRAKAYAHGPARSATRYTEILVGHYDPVKLAQYLRQHARSVESYRGVDVFSFPIENRTLRVALLAIDTVAISNVDDPDVDPRHHRPLQKSGAALRRPIAGARILPQGSAGQPAVGDCAHSCLVRTSPTPRPRSPCPAASTSDSPATAMSWSRCAC